VSSVREPADALFEKFKRLSAKQQHKFATRLAQWREGPAMRDRQSLLDAATVQMPLKDQVRLERLITKSERQELTALERKEYRRLAQQAERLSLLRVQALSELARVASKPISQIAVELARNGS
jgi:hypothetical protein